MKLKFYSVLYSKQAFDNPFIFFSSVAAVPEFY